MQKNAKVADLKLSEIYKMWGETDSIVQCLKAVEALANLLTEGNKKYAEDAVKFIIEKMLMTSEENKKGMRNA